MDIHDLIIIGAGPGGTAAGVYAARKKLDTLLYAKSYGGQSIVSPNIENWTGEISISGVALAKKFRQHLEHYTSDTFRLVSGRCVESLTMGEDGVFLVTDDKGETEKARTILIASGSGRRKLTVEGAEEYEHKGLTYCASCDGPFFTDKDVVVIGGGNAGFETAAQLLAYTKSVTLLHRNKDYKADKITVEKVLADPKMTGITEANITAVRGDGKKVTSIEYEINGEKKELATEGIFVEIGLVPNTGFVQEGLVELDEYKRIKKDPLTHQTSNESIWAIGDASDSLYHQNNIASGEGVTAIENIYLHLKTKK